MKTVGILALQGDFEAHSKAIEKAGGRAIEVRTREEMAQCDGLILPGGESSTMLKLLDYENLLEPLREFGEMKPIYGTCAGAILLAKEVSHPAQRSLARQRRRLLGDPREAVQPVLTGRTIGRCTSAVGLEQLSRGKRPRGDLLGGLSGRQIKH